MNYLAHLYLSDGPAERLYGALLGDFFKGPDLSALGEDVRLGVRLHRAIDSFTDAHPVVQRSVRRLGGRWGWFAGVLVDVFYDHFLAAAWPEYSPEPLRQFADRAYAALLRHKATMPAEMRDRVDSLVRHDRLVNYARTEGIADALERIAERVAERMPRHALPLHESVADLEAHREGFAADFRAFFPAVSAFAADHLRRQAAG